MNEIKLPDRIVTEETRAEARRQLIELVATLPLEKRVAMAQAIHELWRAKFQHSDAGIYGDLEGSVYGDG